MQTYYKTKVERDAVLMKLVAPVAIWALGQIFAVPRIEKSTARFDRAAHKQQERALKSLRRTRKNVIANRGWLAASAAAFALGIGLMSKAAKPRH
jgi:hypothetical protein